MSSRTALIIIGTFRDEWWGLAPIAQAEFVQQVGKITTAAGLSPLTGYRLSATPGAFLEVWEGMDLASVERAVKELTAMGYTHYVEARWLIGERQIEASASSTTLRAGSRPETGNNHGRSASPRTAPPTRRASRIKSSVRSKYGR